MTTQTANLPRVAAQDAPAQFKHLDLVTASVVAVLLISNVAATKIIAFGPLAFDGGTFLFPLAYIFGDVLTEVYGYAAARRVVWTSFVWLAIGALCFGLVGLAPAAEGWELQEAYQSILGQTPRIVLGSLAGFVAGSFTNSYVLARLKLLTGGRALWTRTIGSTLVGQLVDTVAFLAVAFVGVLPGELLLLTLWSNYVFKVAVEVLFTPLTYAVVGWLKRAEGVDVYDSDTNFNPFALSRANR